MHWGIHVERILLGHALICTVDVLNISLQAVKISLSECSPLTVEARSVFSLRDTMLPISDDDI
jgi:hypothetical protein